MRVGLLTTSYPRFPGDYRGIFVEKLVNGLRARGIDVRLIEPRGYGALKAGSGLVANLKASRIAKIEFPFYCLHFFMLALLTALRCDLLHANWTPSGLFAVLAGKLFRKPVVLTERSRLLIQSQDHRLNRFLHWVMRRCDARVTISGSARKQLEGKFPDLDFSVIPNGIDHQMFSPERRARLRSELDFEEDPHDVLSVGRLAEVKRIDTLLSALGALHRRGIHFKARVIGDGELREPLEAITRSEELIEKVAFLGGMPQEDAAKWICASDVLVLCSAGESGGNVILEAMSAGLAVVSTPVGWAADFIEDGRNGLLFPVGDASTLEEKLELLLTTPGATRRLGKAARETVLERELTWPGCAERYERLYREATEARTR